MVVSKVPFFDSIATDLLRRVFGFYILIAAAVTLGHISAEYYYVKDSISKEVRQLQKVFAPTFANALWNLDDKAIATAMEGIGQIGIVAGVKITDESGKTFGASGTGYELNKGDGGILFAYESDLHFKDHHGENLVIGKLHIYSAQGSIFDRIEHNIIWIIVNSIVKTLALWVIFWFFTKKILAVPIGELTDSVQKIELDQIKQAQITIDTASKNELSILTEAFNLMIEKVNGSYQEVTETSCQLKNALQKAEESAQAKSDFLATMSHEIRTPMNGILGMVQILKETDLNESQARFVEILYQSGSNLFHILSDILDFSKIEANQLDLEDREFSLHEVIESSVQLMYLSAGKKNIELICNVHSGLHDQLLGDPTRIRQVISNLFNNAVKFTEKGEVTLEIETLEETETTTKVKFTISDTGIGIPKEFHDELFSNFVQVDSSSTRVFGGTGLGLAICKKLVTLMDGEIDFTSVENEGSKFWFSLELQKNTSYAKATPSFPELEGTRVLIVDGNGANRLFLSQLLHSAGIKQHSCASAIEALELVQGQKGAKFDLAIFDYKIPDIDGLALAKLFKKEPSTLGLPLILLTSVDHLKIVEEAKEAGINFCMGKPVLRSLTLFTLMTQCLIGREVLREEPTEIKQPEQRSLQKQILVAEDDPANCQVILEMLRPFNANLHLAGNGVAALEILKNKPIDLILMDCHMPKMDGWEATSEIRKMPRYKETPIIAITADAYAGDREKCITAGMNDYLPKPINFLNFKAKIEKWL